MYIYSKEEPIVAILKYNLVVKTGEYEAGGPGGQKKNRYLRIGRLMEQPDGGKFILLDAVFLSVQLNIVANRDRRDAIIAGLYEPDSGGNRASGADAGSATAAAEDDIPF